MLYQSSFTRMRTNWSFMYTWIRILDYSLIILASYLGIDLEFKLGVYFAPREKSGTEKLPLRVRSKFVGLSCRGVARGDPIVGVIAARIAHRVTLFMLIDCGTDDSHGCLIFGRPRLRFCISLCLVVGSAWFPLFEGWEKYRIGWNALLHYECEHYPWCTVHWEMLPGF